MYPAAAALVLTLAATASTARAERRTVVTIGLELGALAPTDPAPTPLPSPAVAEMSPEGFGGPRLTLAWEHAALPYPELPGYAVDTTLVPELIAGAFVGEERAEGMIGVGLRGELRVSQKQQGLLRISMRTAYYVAARALVIGEQRDVLGELVAGEYFLLGRTGRLGIELGGVVRREDPMVEARGGVVCQLYLGWQL